MKPGLIVSAIVGIFLGYLTGGSFLVKLVGYFVFLPLGGLSLVLYLFAILYDRKQGRTKDSDRPVVPTSLLIAAFFLSAFLAGEGIFRYRRYEVESFVKETIPLLDAYKDEFGEYPSKLQEVTDRRFPHYFRDRRLFDQPYFSDGGGFTFSYMPPDAMISGLMLTSSDRRWSRAD